jgi:hypothetical protein
MESPQTRFREAQVTARGDKVYVVVSYEQWWSLEQGDDAQGAMAIIREMVERHLREGVES